MPKKKRSEDRAAFVADIHIGNFPQQAGEMRDGLNDRARACIKVFSDSITTAKEQGAKVLFVAGDLFHTRRPEPAIIAAVQHVLHEQAADLPVLIIPGNHDMLDATCEGGNTACAPLFQEATIVNAPEWVDQSGLEMQFLCVPFQSQVPMREYLPKVLAEMKDSAGAKGQKVLVTHVGVYGKDAPHWCSLARDAISADELLTAMTEAGICQAFVGNFHNHERWVLKGIPGAAEIVQVGTLIPHGFGDGGVFPGVGGMAFYDGTDVEMVEVPGPRFITATEESPAPPTGQWALKDAGYVPYLRTDDPVYAQTAEQATGMKAELVGKAVDSVRVELPQVEDADSALSEYVGGLALPPGVERDQVQEQVRAIWKQAAAG